RPAFDSVDVTGLSTTHTVIIGQPAPPSRPNTRALPFAALEDAPADPDVLVTPRIHDVAMIMYTSGTTGPSKGVLMPHGHCYLFGLGLARAMELTADDR